MRVDRLAEADLAALGVHHHGVALGEGAVQELERERVLDQALDGALEGARPVDGIVALARQQLLGGGLEIERDALVGEALGLSGACKPDLAWIYSG